MALFGSPDSRNANLFGNVKSSGEVLDRVEAMLGKDSLDAVGPEMDYRRREVLREMAAPLSFRRMAKHRMDQFAKTAAESQESGSQGVSWLSMVRFWVRRSYSKSVGVVLEKGHYYSLWSSSIKAVEGRNGSGVGTYFRFLRLLLGLNCLTLLLTLSFLFVPQLLDRLFEDGVTVTSPYNGTAKFEDFITGGGWLETTELFYGFYSSGKLNINSDTDSYDMSQAYYYTMFMSYLLIVLIISVGMARSYRKNFIETEGGDAKNVYCKCIFSSCDFAISKEKSMKLQSESVLTELRELMERQILKAQRGARDCSDVYLKVVATALVNIIVVGTLIGIGFLTNFLIDEFGKDVDDFWTQMALSLILTSIIFVIPPIFSLLSGLEIFASVRTKIYLNLTRTVMLEAVVLGVVTVKYLGHQQHHQQQSCWETFFGQEMYRLLLVFFFLLVLINGLVEVCHILLYKHAGLIWFGAPEFDVARNTMHLIYAQTVAWLGLYFSPLLSFVLIIILITSFYLKLGILKLNSGSPRKPWRAAQSKTIFLFFTFFSCIGACIAFFYTIIRSLAPEMNYYCAQS